MRSVAIYYSEAQGRLPDICLRCGKPAVCRVEKTIRLHDLAPMHGRGVLTLIRLAADLRRHFRSATLVLQAPFCAAHRRHWAVRRAIVWAIAALTLFSVLAFWLLRAANVMGDTPAAALTVAVGTLGLVTAAIIIGTSTAKHACNNDAHTFVLHCVHPLFVRALEDRRQQRG